MSSSSPSNPCPECGASLPDPTPEGLCPKCLLLRAAAPTDPGFGQERAAAPPLDAVAAAFPNLEIIELIGQGGMGCVFKARQPQLNRFVALKILPEALARDPAFASRFTREAQALAALSHPNIVTIHDFGRAIPGTDSRAARDSSRASLRPQPPERPAYDPNTPGAPGFFYLLMEYVDGVNLRQALRAGRFTPEQALAIVPPICDALQFAHERGIVHRDIKPENLLLGKSGRVKIADFGIAKMVHGDAAASGPIDADETRRTAAGTPQYMAPEQRQSPQRTDHRADIYSLGVVLYELLTGELPGANLQPPSTKVQIDVRLDEIVLRALQKSPEMRWQTATDLRTQVETVAESMASSSRPAGVHVGGSDGLSPAARSYLALGLFLAGTLGALLLLSISDRHKMVLIFGGLALLLSAAFGFLSWNRRLGRSMALAAIATFIAAGFAALVLAEVIPMPGRQAQLERARRMREAAREQIAQSLAAAHPVPSAPSTNAAMSASEFVRLVAGPDELTFQGAATTWDALPALLESVPNRPRTVLEFATSTDELTVAQVNQLRGRAQLLSQRFGFQYCSHVGVHPLGTFGTPNSPRAIVDQWLAHVQAGRTEAMWELTTREPSGTGFVNLKNTWQFPKIKAYTLAWSDRLAMVMTTRYKDNSGRERAIVFLLVNRDGQWLIRESAVTSPESAENRLEGFAANPEVAFDVRRSDVIGRWTDVFFSPAIYRFAADGGFSMSYRVVGGSRTNLQGVWQLDGDRLSFQTAAGGTTGQVVRVREDFFRIQSSNGNGAGFLRVEDAGGPGGAAKFEFAPVREFTLSTGTNRFVTLDDGRVHASAPAGLPSASVGRDESGTCFIEFHEMHSILLQSTAGIEQWNDASAADLMDDYRRAGFALLPFERFAKYPIRENMLPATILLPGTGFIQVTAIVAGDSPSVTVRCKLVRAAVKSNE